MLNGKQVQYLLMIAQEQNITAAARKLYISQPALSRMLLDLEDALGTPLFLRDRGTLRPTKAGEIYLRGCRELLEVQKSVRREISDLQESLSGKIVIAMTPMCGEFLLPRILNDFEKAYPRVELELVEGRASILSEYVRTGKVDLALTYHDMDADLEFRLLRNDPIYLQIPPYYAEGRQELHPGIHNPPFPPLALNGQPMVLLEKGRGMRKTADMLFERFGITPGRLMETGNIHIANSFVRLNRGFTLVPGLTVRKFFYNDDSSVYCLLDGITLERAMYACYGKGVYLTKAEQYLMELIASVPTAAEE